MTTPEDTTATVDAPPTNLVRTARMAGLFYFLMVPTGIVGFLVIRPVLFEPDDPAATRAQLLENEQLARIAIAVELCLVIAQVLAALWLYRLFRPVDTFVAGTIAVFGLFNATAILASAAFLASALDFALEPLDSAAETAQLMYVVSDNFWGVGAIFFGLWLIPMGLCVVRSGWMPRTLGRLLIAGGIGYVLSAFVNYLVADAEAVATVLTLPATVAEFWMVGYLLTKGVNRRVGQDRVGT